MEDSNIQDPFNAKQQKREINLRIYNSLEQAFKDTLKYDFLTEQEQNQINQTLEHIGLDTDKLKEHIKKNYEDKRDRILDKAKRIADKKEKEEIEHKRKAQAQLKAVQDKRIFANNTSERIKTLLLSNRRPEATEEITQHILKENHIYTTRDDERNQMWIYHEGIYIPQAKTYIKEIVRGLLDECYTVYIVKEIIGKIEVETYIEEEEFFAVKDPAKIACLSGILDVRTGELFGFTPKEVYFNKINSHYKPGIDCPFIKKYFRECLRSEADIKVMQEIFGYLLYRDYKFEKAFMLSGDGRNGKSKTVELMKRWLGVENVSNISLNALEDDQYAMAELFNKMANLSADISRTALKDTGNFKSLTGHDMVSAPRKYLNRINFVNYAKFIFCANTIPESYDMKPAFFDRWVILDFPYYFYTKKKQKELRNSDEKIKWELVKTADQSIIDKISTQEELDGLLNWALEGLNRLLTNKDFSTSTTTEQTKKMWMRRTSSINAFLLDCVLEDSEGQILKEEFRKRYSEYCRKHKLQHSGDRKIKGSLELMFGVGEDRVMEGSSKVSYWVGISWDDEDTNIDNKGIGIDKSTMNGQDRQADSGVPKRVNDVSNPKGQNSLFPVYPVQDEGGVMPVEEEDIKDPVAVLASFEEFELMLSERPDKRMSFDDAVRLVGESQLESWLFSGRVLENPKGWVRLL